MDTYIFQAACYCEDCAKKIKEENLEHQDSEDSENYPQGPYWESRSEADTPQHCDGCKIFLENRLTSDGFDYVCEIIIKSLHDKKISKVVKEWIEYYDFTLKDLIYSVEEKL